MKDFEARRNQETMNLLVSYTVGEDNLAGITYGYEFLGAAYDENANEIHVFKMKDLKGE